MFTSDIESGRRELLRLAGLDLGAAVLCGVFGAVYERFSFGVYSPFMALAFLPLLLLGTLPCLLLGLGAGRQVPSPLARRLWHAGLAALTAGSLFRGVLDIYGTASGLTAVYWLAGGSLLAAGLGLSLFSRKNRIEA